MNEIVQRIIANSLSDFKGLSVEGEIPVTEKMLNDLIQLGIKSMKTPTSSEKQPSAKPATESSGAQEDSVDFTKVLDDLDEKEIKIELKEKGAVLKINIKKY